MKVCLNFCKNCGAEYRYQASGSHWSLDTPKEYNDFDYCPECKKVIVDVLVKIPKKTEIRCIDTNDFTLDELLLKQEEYNNTLKLQQNGFPTTQQIFLSVTKADLSDITTTKKININNIDYYYTYWKKSKEVISIKKEVRWDLINDCEYPPRGVVNY